jgi:hypothetical protein
MYSGASVSSISSRGEALDPNLLYPPLEEEGPPLFLNSHRSYFINDVNFTFAETGHFYLTLNISSVKFGFATQNFQRRNFSKTF